MPFSETLPAMMLEAESGSHSSTSATSVTCLMCGCVSVLRDTLRYAEKYPGAATSNGFPSGFPRPSCVGGAVELQDISCTRSSAIAAFDTTSTSSLFMIGHLYVVHAFVCDNNGPAQMQSRSSVTSAP